MDRYSLAADAMNLSVISTKKSSKKYGMEAPTGFSGERRFELTDGKHRLGDVIVTVAFIIQQTSRFIGCFTQYVRRFKKWNIRVSDFKVQVLGFGVGYPGILTGPSGSAKVAV